MSELTEFLIYPRTETIIKRLLIILWRIIMSQNNILRKYAIILVLQNCFRCYIIKLLSREFQILISQNYKTQGKLFLKRLDRWKGIV